MIEFMHAHLLLTLIVAIAYLSAGTYFCKWVVPDVETVHKKNNEYNFHTTMMKIGWQTISATIGWPLYLVFWAGMVVCFFVGIMKMGLIRKTWY